MKFFRQGKSACKKIILVAAFLLLITEELQQYSLIGFAYKFEKKGYIVKSHLRAQTGWDGPE
jgi:hypothetical protein